jgi:putative transposase
LLSFLERNFSGSDFPPWKTVYHWFRKWRINGPFEWLNLALRKRLRTRVGRKRQPSARIVDSQSAKTSRVVGGEARGYDGGKKIRERKRHLIVDTEGLVLKAKVHSAKVPDQDGIKLLLKAARERLFHASRICGWMQVTRAGARSGQSRGAWAKCRGCASHAEADT